jgi:stress-induced morphogen
MTKVMQPWESMRTDESRLVEQVLRQEFPQVDAYRYNSASIRVRVIDPRFEGKSVADRDAMVEPFLAQLPQDTQTDIMNLLTLAPTELGQVHKSFLNDEFENPSPSML